MTTPTQDEDARLDFEFIWKELGFRESFLDSWNGDKFNNPDAQFAWTFYRSAALKHQREAELVRYVAVNEANYEAKHPNDKNSYSEELKEQFKIMGDSEGQGLHPFWKWGYSSGWCDFERKHPREASAVPDDVATDAARYRWLRDGNDKKNSVAMHIAQNCYGLEWDEAIDAAMLSASPTPEQKKD